MNNNVMHHFIVSAEKSNRPSMVNSANTKELTLKLSELGYPFTQAQGCYNGTTEVSFIVACQFKDMPKLKRELLAIADSYAQDCIAYVDNESRLTLEYSNGISEYIGKLSVDNEASDAYTSVNGMKYSAK